MKRPLPEPETQSEPSTSLLLSAPLPAFLPPPGKPPSSHPSKILPNILSSLSSHPLVFAHDDTFAVVYDGYPKSAAGHLLVLLPGHPSIGSLNDVTAAHLPIFLEMQELADKLCKHIAPSPKHPPLVGFHAIPSLRPLHLHVLPSGLVDGPLRTLRHVTTFSTPFFVPLSAVISFLSSSLIPVPLRVKADRARALETAAAATTTLRCHLCKGWTCAPSAGSVAVRLSLWREHQRECPGGAAGGRGAGQVSSLLEWGIEDPLGKLHQ
ncbi:hypothetical protein TeGR_g3367 [Tetraparma gracilis]|uniref:HIT domain-containing protein n=1 Tax=Tetraparma gracilis TaxID=2962635 RepID=A0ABQ6MB53_9STRA|nr:hypothetical protein TeGR_g3367 [Tetraparma gracilis]